MTQKALSRCSFLPGARVLDIGCGVGGTVEYLMEHHQLRAFGIDPSLTILNHGHARNAALPLIAADGKALPFSDATWDGVFAECSLSLVKDSRRMLGECFRVLRNEGWLVLSDVYLRDPAAGVQVRALPSCCCLAGAMTHEELLEAITSCGFQTVHWEDHSPALKAFAAQLVFFHDSSIEQFWMRAAQDKGEAVALPELKKVIAQARPGYFLLIARKSAEY